MCCIAVGHLKASVVPFVTFGVFFKLTPITAIYSTRPLRLHCDPRPDRWHRVVGPLYRRGSLARSSR
jgi:hypothetical protein